MSAPTDEIRRLDTLSGTETQFRKWLLERLLVFSTIAGALLLLVWIPAVIARGFLWQIPIFIGVYVVLLALTLIKTAPSMLRMSVFLVMLLGTGTYILLQNGLVGAGRFWLLLAPLLATFLLGSRGLWLWSILALGCYAGTALAFDQGWVGPLLQVQNPIDLGSWAMEAIVPIGVLTVLGLAIVQYRRALHQSMAEVQRSVELARDLQLQAEDDAARARRQADRLDRVTGLARIIARLRDRDELLQRLVNDLVTTFGLYQVNFFLVDPRGERLTLHAAAGAQGQELVATGWSLLVGDDSLPGRVAQIGIAEATIPPADVRFPLRQAEAALPLLFGGELLGVLDIYGSRKPFAEEDMRIFRVLADQVAATLNVLRLLEETRARAQELRTLYAQVAGTSWRALLEVEGVARRHSSGVIPEAAVEALAAQALAAGAPRVAPFSGEATGWLLVVPLLWREMTLGYLAFSRLAASSEEASPWDAETLGLAAAAAERLAVAFDTVRLLRDSRRKALYQEQLARVGDLIWSSFDVETIMRHGVRELGSLLDAGEVTLHLAPPAPQVAQLPGTGPLPPLEYGEEDA